MLEHTETPWFLMCSAVTGLSYANDYHTDFCGAIILAHIANSQLLLGMPNQSLRLLDKASVQILAHGGHYDRGRIMLLYAKCLVASVRGKLEEERTRVIKEAANMLNKARHNFKQVSSYLKQRDTLYLQVSTSNCARCLKFYHKFVLGAAVWRGWHDKWTQQVCLEIQAPTRGELLW